MTLQERVKALFPWLVAEWNGAEWESERQMHRRKIGALEAHLRSLEERYAEIENRLNDHTQGTKHRTPKSKLPIMEEWK